VQWSSSLAGNLNQTQFQTRAKSTVMVAPQAMYTGNSCAGMGNGEIAGMTAVARCSLKM